MQTSKAGKQAKAVKQYGLSPVNKLFKASNLDQRPITEQQGRTTSGAQMNQRTGGAGANDLNEYFMPKKRIATNHQ